MRKISLIITISLLFMLCGRERASRDFFNDLQGYPDFLSSKGKSPLFGFDSLIIDSLSTSIDGRNYWYLNTTSNALFNINGYTRSVDKIVYIKPGDKDRSRSNEEQVLFDFSGRYH